MPTDNGKHLDAEQISSFVEAIHPNDEATVHASAFEADRRHLAQCTLCSSRVDAQERVAAALRSLEARVNSERSHSCPHEQKWIELAAGILSGDESAALLQHAARCDYCGPLLRVAIEDLATELSPQERVGLSQLKSAEQEWQRALAVQMAAKFHTVSETRAGNEPKKHWLRFLSFEGKSGTLRWAGATVVALMLAIAGSLWLVSGGPSIGSANRLIAKAYGEQRDIALRFPDVPRTENDQVRGEDKDSLESLNAAQKLVARGLAKHPTNPQWRQAGARIDLLQHSFPRALDTLEPLVQEAPNDVSLRIDEAWAYYEASQYDRAIADLNHVLALQPSNLVALFNKAKIYETMGDRANAYKAWKAYLDCDASSPWAKEAQEGLNSSSK